jgi:predicted membrane protein
MRTDWTAHRAYRFRPNSANGRSANSNAIVGVILIAFGALLLLKNYGVFSVRDVFSFWPILPVIWGCQAIARGRSTFSYLVGGMAVTLGSMKLLDNLGIIDISSKIYAPLVLISIGTAFLIYNLRGEPVDKKDGSVVTSSTIHPMIVFGGAVQRVDSQEFEGGEVLCVFGGVDLDMRKAKMKSEVAIIEVNAIFGGCHLKVPETWSVEIRGTGAFGGYEDKTIAPRPGEGPQQKLIVSGNAVFGGIGIEN